MALREIVRDHWLNDAASEALESIIHRVSVSFGFCRVRVEAGQTLFFSGNTEADGRVDQCVRGSRFKFGCVLRIDGLTRLLRDSLAPLGDRRRVAGELIQEFWRSELSMREAGLQPQGGRQVSC